MSINYFDETTDFKRLKPSPVKTHIALSRLENPWGLDRDRLKMYEDYLAEERPATVEKLIDTNRKELFPLLVKYRVIKRNNILSFIDYARDNRKNEILFYLMEAANLLRTNSKSLKLYKKGSADLNCNSNVDFAKARPGEILWIGQKATPFQVLENRDGKLLIISLYCLCCMPYTNFYRGFTTWSRSTVKLKLKTEILPVILTRQEREKIVPVYIDDQDDSLSFEPKEKTEADLMFLLSVKETEKYFKTPESRLAPATKRCMLTPLWTIFDRYAYWWLRSPGSHPMEKMYVRDGLITSENSIVNGDDCFDYFGVRPALYIKY